MDWHAKAVAELACWFGWLPDEEARCICLDPVHGKPHTTAGNGKQAELVG